MARRGIADRVRWCRAVSRELKAKVEDLRASGAGRVFVALVRKKILLSSILTPKPKAQNVIQVAKNRDVTGICNKIGS